ACKDDDHGRIIRLCILLGSRRAEIGAARGSEFLDLEGPQPRWRLPPERSKTHREHVLPLLPMALAIIPRLPRMAGGDQLFGTRSDAGFNAWHVSKLALDQRSGVTGWTVHDLRRTFSTKLHDLGVAPHVVEEILSHRAHRSGARGHYNYSRYEREVRAALALWEDLVESLVEDRERKVVAFVPNQNA